MMWNKLKLIAALGLMAGLTVGGAGLAAQQGGNGQAEVRAEREPISKIEVRIEKEPTPGNFDERERLEKELEVAERRIKELTGLLQELERKWKDLAAEVDPDVKSKGGTTHLSITIEERNRVKQDLEVMLKKAEYLKFRLNQLGPSNTPTPTVRELAEKLVGRAGSLEKDLKAANERINQLEKQLADQRATIQPLQERRDKPAMAPQPSAAPGNLEAAVGPGGGIEKANVPSKASVQPPPVITPAPEPIVHTLQPNTMMGEPVLFAVISAGRDRVTMINSVTKDRAIFRMPNAAKEIIPIVGSSFISLNIKGPEVTRAALYDRKDQRWYECDLKEPAWEVGAITGTSMMATGMEPTGLSIQGPTCTRLAVFDQQDKKWTTQDLREPAKDGVYPMVTSTTATYSVGRFLYKYSAIAKKWSVLELKREIPAASGFVQAGGDDKTVIPDGDVIHVYDPKTGDWTHIDTKDDK